MIDKDNKIVFIVSIFIGKGIQLSFCIPLKSRNIVATEHAMVALEHGDKILTSAFY